MPNLLVRESNLSLDDHKIYFHGDMDSWYSNPKIDTTIKLAMLLTFYYTKDDNKDVNPIERLRVQNSFLVKKFGLSERMDSNGSMMGISTVQKAIRHLVNTGFIKNRFYIGTGQELVSFDENPQGGLTGRRFELSTSDMKTLLRAVPGDDTYQSYQPRSRERRMILRRPMSIIDMINNTVVRDLKQKKKAFNKYVLTQIKRYTNQNVTLDEELEKESTLDAATEDRLINACIDVVRLLHINVDSII